MLKRMLTKVEEMKLSGYVVFSIATLLVYAIAEIALTCIFHEPHDTLTTCMFGTFGGEILSCALIKIFKLKRQ